MMLPDGQDAVAVVALDALQNWLSSAALPRTEGVTAEKSTKTNKKK